MTIKQFLDQWGFTVASALLLVVAFVMLTVNSCHVDSYRQQSELHTITIHLHDDASWQDVDEIVRSMEGMTHQHVYNEALDRDGKVYRLKVKCPPSHAKNLWNWLSGRSAVERVEVK